jgi:large subunit ribosomal protein L19
MTKTKIIDEIEKNQMKENIPDINVGDTVCISKLITEGKKQRIQKFEGIVIKQQGSNSRKSITVRKIFGQFGVEKSFLIHSSLVPEIKVLKRGKVRRAKLNYLRNRIGAKATRVKTKD